ncbi:MAG: metal ABC transporter substrate-binding protein [Nitriliruptoraceae bacterium]
MRHDLRLARARHASWLVLLAMSLVLAACGTGTDGTTAQEDGDSTAAEEGTDSEGTDDAAAGAEDDTDSAAAAAGEDAAPPLVVVTTTILGDIVENVAGGEATVEVLMPLGADPHAFEVSAQQAALLRDADLVVANGLGLEEGLLDAVAAAEEEGARVLEVGPALDPMPFEGPDGHEDEDEHGHEDEDEHGHEDDDEHAEEGEDEHAEEGEDAHAHEGGLDAHVWMDPVRMAEAVDLIATAFTEVADGDFLARGASYRAEVEALHEDIEAMIATVPEADRKLVTNHFAYGYYAQRYGLELLGTVIPAATTEAETSAAGFAELIEIVEDAGVSAIFASTTESTSLAEAIAGEVGRDVQVLSLYTGSLGEDGSGAETYVGMMMTSTERIVEGLTA